MATVGNNTSAKYEYLRESFFTRGERKQFNKIMKKTQEQEIHNQLIEQDVNQLYLKAMDLIKRVELGEFNEEEMEVVEYKIAHYLAAIEDVHKELILEKTRD